MSDTPTPSLFVDLLRAMRPTQWTKNAVVLAAFFFALGDRSQPFAHVPALLTVLAATALFCLASSGIYVFNDIIDVDADRAHPVKRLRPLPSGRISLAQARLLAVALLLGSIGGSWLLSPAFCTVVCVYVVLQLLYSLWLKNLALVDVLLIASGFVLRAIAGAVVLAVHISPWLLLCAFLLALFLGLCKRRHEKILLIENGGDHRRALHGYDERLLDQLIAISSSATVTAYSIYTLWPGTVEKFHTSALGFTIPFVLFGIFRYLDLVYRKDQGGQPERILLTDVPLILDLFLYGLAVIGVFVFFT